MVALSVSPLMQLAPTPARSVLWSAAIATAESKQALPRGGAWKYEASGVRTISSSLDKEETRAIFAVFIQPQSFSRRRYDQFALRGRARSCVSQQLRR